MPQKTFCLFVRRDVSSARKCFGRFEHFSKTRSARRRRFRQKIIEIGAILAIFKPFEVLLFGNNLEQIDEKMHMPLLGEFSRSSQDLYRNPLQIEHSPGRLSKFFEEWRVAF